LVKEVIGETESLCPVCLQKIPAKRVSEDERVYLEKTCPDHGDYKVLVWRRGGKHYLDWGRCSQQAAAPPKRLTDTDKGCPYDCGLCPTHKANTCSMLIEVTSRCNLHCPICFASANETEEHEPDFNMVGKIYETVLDTVGSCTVQLSGGEPTLRDDLPEIVSLGRKMGLSHILVNTNGIRLAKDKAYLQKLKESGTSAIYLQFDGVTDKVYHSIRGVNLFDLKVQAIKNCAEVKMGVILVPTIVPRINDHELGEIFEFAKKWVPVVKAIHFQPVSYFGRYPKAPKDEDRITIPDVIDALVSQSNGQLKIENFPPHTCQDSHCGFSGLFVLREDGELFAATKLANELVSGWGFMSEAGDAKARRFMSRHWRFTEEEAGQAHDSNADLGSQPGSSRRALTHSLAVTCMPFQDVWNIDLQRLQGCCGHVATADKRIVPICAFYLTSVCGQRLHSTDWFSLQKGCPDSRGCP